MSDDFQPDPKDGVLAEVIVEAKRNGNYETVTTASGQTIGLFARGEPGALDAAKAHVRAEIVAYARKQRRKALSDSNLVPSTH